MKNTIIPSNSDGNNNKPMSSPQNSIQTTLANQILYFRDLIQKTILSILAQERGIKDNSDAFDKIKLIQDPTEKIKEAQKLFTSWEILKQCSALQEDYLQKAVENLDSIETSGNKDNFIELSNYLFHRTH